MAPASVTLPEGHSVASGNFTVPAGRSVECGGVRFSCAAGGAACAVTVDAGSGMARATGGRLTVARIQAAAPPPNDGGQDGGMEEADWPFPDWPIADLTRAVGPPLSWSPSEIYNRIRAIEDRRVFDSFAAASGTTAVWCTGAFSDEDYCNTEYRSVMTYRGIPIVQGRVLSGLNSGVGGRPAEEIGVGGILERGYFMVAWARDYIGRDYEDEEIEAELRETWAFGGGSGVLLDPPTTGSWQGALIGTGRSATSPLYRQFIIGDVEVTVSSISDSASSVDVAFSNIQNLSTGDRNVTLSHTRWNMRASTKRPSELYQTRPGYIRIHFLGPNDEEVLGVFHTEEAVGGFGAKKQ